MSKTKKLTLSLLSAIFLCFGIAACGPFDEPADGPQGEQNGGTTAPDDKRLSYSLSEDESYYIVKAVDDALSGEIEIPDEYQGKPVKEIADYAFSDCSNLTSITIGSGVTSIGDYAFNGCSGLESIEIPNGVTSIGNGAFYGCEALTSVQWNAVNCTKAGFNNYPIFEGCTQLSTVTFGESVQTIPAYAFYKCDGLTEALKIPDSVTSIGRSAFYDCGNLTSVTIGNGVTSIRDYAFSYCSGLTSIEIPDGVTSIGDGAFRNCDGLTSIEIPDSVTSIGGFAFSDCSNLTSVTIGNNVTSIGDNAFSGCSNLTSIVIPASVTSIGICAFSGCNGLESITVPFVGNGGSQTHFGYIFGASQYSYNSSYVPSSLKNVTITGGEIGERAFYDCGNLTSVTIGNGVTYIGDYAFAGCGNLTSVQWNAVNCTKAGSYQYDGVHPIFEGCTQLSTVTFGESVQTIPAYAFYKCDGLTEALKIPDSVTSIGWSAFRDCSKLTSVTIGNGVTSIKDSAFEGCSGLTSIEIPEGVTSIERYAFWGCSGLTSIEIPESVTSIGDLAFEGCSGLEIITVAEENKNYSSQDGILYNKAKTEFIHIPKAIKGEVTIPDGVTSIGQEAFEDCSNLTSIEIPDSVTSIGSYAFYECSGLESIEIPDSVTSIGSRAFYGCGGLTSVTIGNGVTSIGDQAFQNCIGLTGELKIPDSVTYIGDSAFEDCSKLTSVTIGNGVTYIRDSAFEDCRGLTGELKIPDSVTSIGWSAFYNCSKLTSVTIGNGVTSIGERAFYGCSGLEIITVAEENKNYSSQDGILYNKAKTEFIHIPKAIKGEVTIPDSVTSIGFGAFEGCNGLESITVPFVGNGSDKTHFGYIFGASQYSDNSSYVPSSLKNVTITGGEIGDWAFEDCSNLTSVTIGNGVTSIGRYAFEGCDNIASVTFKNADGWKVSENSDMSDAQTVEVNDPEQNATYLKDTYRYYYWKRGE